MEVVRRLSPKITFRSSRARMPRFVMIGSILKNAGILNILSMRKTRFRLAARCLAWTDREGSNVLKAFLDKILPPACRQAHSTESFRDFTEYAVAQAKAPNKGNFLKRDGKWALHEANRASTKPGRETAVEQALCPTQGDSGRFTSPCKT